MIGKIGFKGQKISCIIGVFPHEREKEQEVFVDLKVEVNFSKSVMSDQLKDTINYLELDSLVRQVSSQKFQLLETLATHIVDEIFRRFPALSVWIRIQKPNSLKGAKCALVELKRIRDE